ncbi:MAG TPA: hypothetical protein VMB85_01650 [Bryobacteraceae bacterium]|jgi:hypothetical protein|nr:hypothetical protein [Bryobacteraceae bacterium]
MKKFVLLFSTLALMVASAAENTYHFTLQEPASVNGTILKPGDYRIQVEGDKAILKYGKKTVIEAPAKLETAEHKYSNTSVDLDSVNNRPRISEIHLGGTKTRIIFSNSAAAGQ